MAENENEISGDFEKYQETAEDENEKIKNDSEQYLFSEEERQRGLEKAGETIAAKGAITRSLDNITKEFREISGLLMQTEIYKDTGLRLYVISKYVKNRTRLVDSLIDLAAGICIGKIKAKVNGEDKEENLRVYQERPSLMAHKILSELMDISGPGDDKKNKISKTAKEKSGPNYEFNDIA